MEHPALITFFLYSLGILYREGLEAMLVVVALAAGTREAGHGNRARSVYIGAGLAIVASAIIAWVLNRFLGNQRSEMLEGVFQILAAGTLFYVSSWITAKTGAERWEGFISRQIEGARRSSLPYFAIGLTAFLAVMREGAETILFFQAVLAGTNASVERHAIAAGAVGGALALILTFVILTRAAYRIPMRMLFRVTTYLLYGLAVVFIGQGIESFQASGLLPTTVVAHVPTLPMLGIYPSVETIVAQALLLLLAAAAIVVPHGTRRREPTARDA